MPNVENTEFRLAFKGKVVGTLRVLGNEKNPGEGLLSIGNYMALDHSRGCLLYTSDAADE